MDKLVVTISGIVSIATIVWFFFGKQKEAAEAGNNLTISVDGGYKPNFIRLRKGKPTTLTFLRKDENPCLEEIVLPEFKVKKYLPMNESVSITITPDKPGIYGIHCGMNMFHGRIEVT